MYIYRYWYIPWNREENFLCFTRIPSSHTDPKQKLAGAHRSAIRRPNRKHFGPVDLVDACASHGDHSQSREQPEELVVDYGAAVSGQGEDGGLVRSEELVQRQLGFPGLEDSELNSDGKRAIAGDQLIIRTRGHRSQPWECWIWAASAIAELKSSWICQKAEFTEQPAGMKDD